MSLVENFEVNSRVFYWTASSEIVYGTIKKINRMVDNTLILVIEEDAPPGQKKRVVALPAAGVTKVLT